MQVTAQVRALLGRLVTLPVRGTIDAGALLAVDEERSILLPRREVPPDAVEGTELEVFVTLDSEDRPLATVTTPRLILGEVCFLSVTDVTPFGAFFDWGLPKELLVPKKEQTREPRVGERHPIGLYLDDTDRLAGTMRVSELLRDVGDFTADEWVDGEAWRNEPELGLFVIVERAFVGLLPAEEPHRLARGDQARFRVARVLADGKIELSLRGLAHQERDKDAELILARLSAPKPLRISERESPETIRGLLGISKKAFKRAVGALLKRGVVEVDAEGIVVLKK
ncbi:MAG: S1-like domain-containing RNA-binding protein [Polyangiales bacterium]